MTVTARRPRPPAADPAYRGPYPVGPFAVPTAARQGGRGGPRQPTVRLRFAPAAPAPGTGRPAAGPVARGKSATPRRARRHCPGRCCTLDARRDSRAGRVEPAVRPPAGRDRVAAAADRSAVMTVRAEVGRRWRAAGWRTWRRPLGRAGGRGAGGPGGRSAGRPPLNAPQKGAVDLTCRPCMPGRRRPSKAASIPGQVPRRTRWRRTAADRPSVHAGGDRASMPATPADEAASGRPTAGPGAHRRRPRPPSAAFDDRRSGGSI
ncbi:MAG: hypothetical protein U0871_10470 [Gemmataceae bacterium]